MMIGFSSFAVSEGERCCCCLDWGGLDLVGLDFLGGDCFVSSEEGALRFVDLGDVLEVDFVSFPFAGLDLVRGKSSMWDCLLELLVTAIANLVFYGVNRLYE